MATLSLAAILAESARRHPDKAGLVEGELRITFKELWLQARKQAAALIAAGVRPGDKVALMAPNVAEFPRAYYAALAAGAVVVPVHLLLSAGEVEHVLRDSGATLLLCHPGQAKTGGAAAEATGVRMLTLGEEATWSGSRTTPSPCPRTSPATRTTPPSCSTRAAPPASPRAPSSAISTW